MNNLNFYDSDLNSENEEAKFESDHEPPKDRVHDKKSIFKSKELKIYKTIVQVGKGVHRPAKYDEVQYKLIKLEDANLSNNTEKLLEQEVLTTNLGINKYESWFDKVVENVRKDEICLITLKYISKLPNSDQKVQRFEYHQLYLIDWTTIIDLDQNFNYMKRVNKKGEGQHRCSDSDEVTFLYRIRVGDKVLEEKVFKETILNKIEERLPSNVIKVLHTMKRCEEVVCTINQETFEKYEKNAETLNLLKDLPNKSEPIQLDIDLEEVTPIEDIFDDGDVLKKVIVKGSSTAKAENNSEVFFNYRIIDVTTNKELYCSGEMNPNEELVEILRNPETVRTSNKCLRLFLDEYKISRMMKHVIRKMKKMERSNVLVNSFRYITYGQDHESISAFPEIINRAEASLRYEIYVFFFVEGKNSFTMTMDEKMSHAERKKEIGVAQLKNGQNKRALKVFENINSYFDLGTFTETDKARCKQIHLSSLLNTSLAMIKLEKWKEILLVTDKLLKLERNNMKAVYRRAMALRIFTEYEEALKLLKETMVNISNIDPERKNTDKVQFKELEKLYAQIEVDQKKFEQNEKSVFKKMFS